MSSTYCFLYCAYLCFTLSEWKDIALTIAAVIAVPGAIFTALKTFRELRERRIENQKSLQLRRIEFTLEQHRRLFDDSTLNSVLCLIDSDSDILAQESMWDPKRKFITFFEEIALLISSEQINNKVAYYMFGYYAICARNGKNFQIGIDLREEYWGVFFRFTEDAEKFIDECKRNPQLIFDLKL